MKLTRCDVCGKDGPANPFGWIEVHPIIGQSILAEMGWQRMASPLQACSLRCIATWVNQRIDDELLVGIDVDQEA